MRSAENERRGASIEAQQIRGFILQPAYRIEWGRPVIHLYGRLENGESFLLRDDRTAPHFYVRRRDSERARSLGARRQRESRRRTMEGEPLVEVVVKTPGDAPPLRGQLFRSGVPCYEADVPFARRFLIDRGIRGSLELEGAWGEVEGLGRVYQNPRVRPVRWTPRLSALSIDIETDPSAKRVLSIALYGAGASEVLVFDPRERSLPGNARGFSRERDLLLHFCKRVKEIDPDILTGWNLIDFDLRVLQNWASRVSVSLKLGRDRGELRLRPARSSWRTWEASVPGRLVLDGIDLIRGAYVKAERYSLDFVANQVLGRGKQIGGRHRAEEILECYRSDLPRLVDYNLNDAELVTRILGRLKLIELAVERSLLTGMPIDRVSSSIAAFDFLYLSQLHVRRVAAPSVRRSEQPPPENPGGLVFDSQPGLYDNVLVFDFKSLYPSLIRTFQIDPLGHLPDPTAEDDPIVAPNGAAFRRKAGILPRLIDELFPRREEAISRKDRVASHAIKILMNSFYGVLGTRACRFYRPELAGAITTFGQLILRWTRSQFESEGLRVLYGDTDSLFVLSGCSEAGEAGRLGRQLAALINSRLSDHVRSEWGVESRLELQLEGLYHKLHLPATRQGTGGARKRYAGLVEREGRREVVFTGMEVVRRDWTDLARQVQRELYDRLFSGRPLENYLERITVELRAGKLDHLLVYRKALRKGLDSYTATTPPHVTAARKSKKRPRRLVSYLMTTRGPEPAAERRNSIDYEHYVQKQIRPVAEPLLELHGLHFAKVIGDDTQMELF